MKKLLRRVALLTGVVVSGAFSSVSGQTGDCFNQLPGCLDAGFGVNGRVTAPSGMQVNGIAIQTVAGEERIIVVGETYAAKRTPPKSWIVVRYLPDGSLDPSFGSGGIVKMTPKSGFYAAGAVVVQPDNKLVVAGWGSYSGKQDIPLVARYNENGSPDSTFGSGGKIFVPCVYNSKIGGATAAVALQADGKILITGQYGWIASRRLFVCRLNANGLLDTTFNGTGQYLILDAIGDGTDIATQWIGQEERIVVTGHLIYGPYSTTYGKAAILRFGNSGQPDTSFNGSGKVLMDLDPYNDYAAALAVDSDNRLLALISGGLARFDVSGTLDSTFGVSGIAVSPHEGFGFGSDFAFQADQKILCPGGFGENCVAVQRFDANGVSDPSFGFDGWITTDLGNYRTGGYIAVQSDGKFVVAGTSDKNPALARYWQ
jgi:uncharacterized delta-60 repeat protein